MKLPLWSNIFPSVSMLRYPADEPLVCLHHGGVVDGREVDLRGLDVFVPKSAADNGDVVAHVSHD